MDAPLTLGSAFLLGLFTSLHCVGMCGGIIGALSLGLPAKIRDNKLQLLFFVGTYNLGRIISYSLAGLLAGAVGTEILTSVGFEQGHQILQYIGIAMMISVGLYLSGWLPQLAYVERIGRPLWKKLEPFGRRLLPVSNPFKALAYGLVWGWLPCGMVYFVLIWALSAGSAVQGALLMLAFGLGTLPTLLTAGFMTSWLTRFASNAKVRSMVGLIIIAMAIGSLFIPMQHNNHGTAQPDQMDPSEHMHHH
ncbi:MAG: sulfite exporter TauE/SafE family protein [Gammaproteobacteria bacterium]|nr:sulfite exporter TauE/SafE family protein [Gammaproteobacteria bacterium]